MEDFASIEKVALGDNGLQKQKSIDLIREVHERILASCRGYAKEMPMSKPQNKLGFQNIWTQIIDKARQKAYMVFERSRHFNA